MIGIDFEYVAAKAVEGRRPDVQNEYCEIMQIGACRLNDLGEEQATLNIAVNAFKVTHLPEWLERLTGMSDEKRAQGVSFPSALKQLYSFAARAEIWTFSGDWFVLERNCAAHGIPNPFKRPFFRAKPLLDHCGVGMKDYKEYGFAEVNSGDLYKVLGIELPRIEVSGSAHDASHDARSLVHSVFKLRFASVVSTLSPQETIKILLAPPRLFPMDDGHAGKQGATVGWIGLGAMGAPMAKNLRKSGFFVNAWNRSEHPDKTMSCIADVCKAPETRFVCSMLSNDAATRECVLGEHGVLESMLQESIYVNFATLSLSLVDEIALAFESANRQFVNCPVFGRPDAAASQSLFLIPGGSAKNLGQCIALFHALGKKSFPQQSCQISCVAKVCGNFLISSTIESLAEIFVVSSKHGLEPAMMLEILSGTLFGSKIVNGYGDRIVKEEFRPAGFTMTLGLKDINLFLEASEKVNVPCPVASVVKNRFLEGIAQGGAELDWSAIALSVARSAGMKK